nr:transglutaminase-like cysteine peptidase [uncultured Devosia sp.]
MSATFATIVLASLIGSASNTAFTAPLLNISDFHSETSVTSTSRLSLDIDLVLKTPVAPVASTARVPVAVTSVDLGVFQSVAISAARLPAAAKWRDLQQTDYSGFFSADCDVLGFSQCDSRFASAVRSAAEQASELGDRDMLDLVNRSVNGAMTYRDDSKVWGMGDYWANPAEMARMGAGDCEDYAIAKYWTLRSLGVADEQLQIVVLQDTRRQLFHAVLVAHMESGSYVLDNVSNRLLTDANYGQYQPIMSFAGAGNFIHGFESGARDVADMPADLSAIAPGSGI